MYEWDQTLTEVNMYIGVPPDLKAKEIFCDINKQHLKFGRQGNPPFMDVSVPAAAAAAWGYHTGGQQSAVWCNQLARRNRVVDPLLSTLSRMA